MKNMTYKLYPPTKDYFSRQWFHNDDFVITTMTDDLYSRINSTRSKLNELESKLRGKQSLDSRKYNPNIHSFCTRIGWVRSYIGVWRPRGTDDGTEWDAQMVYPHTKMVMSKWDETILGELNTTGYLLVLLSTEVVEWLNEVDKWVSFPHLYTVSTTT